MDEPRAPSGKTATLDEVPAMTGARVFVTLVFLALGAAFIAQTALAIWEFQALDWPAMLLLHSHLFVFFPTFGVLALVAFHLPATVFTHMYWTHISHGRLRFIIGAVAAVVASLIVSFNVGVSNPAELWQISPQVLRQDRAESVACDGAQQSCRRVALLDGLSRLRREAQLRLGVSKFARPCNVDEMLEVPADFVASRYCFAAGVNLPGRACCEVQSSFRTRVADLAESTQDRSLTDVADQVVQPLKAFFVLVVIVIGVLLVIWRRLLEQQYAPIAPAIERALLIGAAAMVPWPFMDYAYAQAMQTLTGRVTAALDLRLSLVIVPWALLLLVFFLARMGRKIERLGQLAGAGASVIAVLRYDQLNDVGVRFLGIGAPWWMAIVLAVVLVACLMALRWPRHLQRAINGAIGRHPDVGMGPPPGFRT